ncbi:PAS domain-containing sensor histidine kinase [Antarctobacter sp.]|uniref:PAS domain-containing sensor histidine kinase n=1 Tax=Antarctobacter sp. TaxID=1872577 RepID=UPI002B27896C|nr:PAS domain-containing sensor histidine kinase [Antarctobacter sp.]
MTPSERALLDLIDHPVFCIEPDLAGVPRYGAINLVARTALGREEHQILGRSAAELYPGPLGEIAQEHHREALRDGNQRRYEVVLPMPQGERCFRTTLTPEKDALGRVTRLIGTSLDISSQNTMVSVSADAERLAAELEDFVYLAAHDLRAPIRNVGTIAEILREDFVDHGDGKLELIEMLGEMADKTKVLIGDVLAHAQATAATAEWVHFDFEDLVWRIMQMLDPMGRVNWSAPPITIDGDRATTQIVLRNLIDNALKYAHPAENWQDEDSALELRFDVISTQEGTYSVLIDDNGIGFNDLNREVKPSSSGGFGLMAVRRLLGRRGGELTVGNKPGGGGARLAFMLPGTCIGLHRERLRATA